MEYTFSNVRHLTEDELHIDEGNINRNALGFHVGPSFFRVLDLEECYLPPPVSDHIRLGVRSYALQHGLSFYDIVKHEGFLRILLIRHTLDGQCMVIVVFGCEDKPRQEALLDFISGRFPEITSLHYVINEKKNDIISDLPVHHYRGEAYLEETLGDVRFRIGPVSFFQTNSYQALPLYETVKALAGVQPGELVYDLYTGTGTIANFIARDAGRVIGIDYVPQAVEDAHENSARNGITNTEFYSGDMAKVLNDEFIAAHGRPHVIITDPPRSGMHRKVVDQILQVSPERIVYVSCNPSTQARDAEILKEKYRIEKVQPLDMFPHTQHVESVMLLRRNAM
jgi:23S rRNA (uracil1939-C5)-methyltransferase